jgi:LPXTG-motif cell wall-anchored protein
LTFRYTDPETGKVLTQTVQISVADGHHTLSGAIVVTNVAADHNQLIYDAVEISNDEMDKNTIQPVTGTLYDQNTGRILGTASGSFAVDETGKASTILVYNIDTTGLDGHTLVSVVTFEDPITLVGTGTVTVLPVPQVTDAAASGNASIGYTLTGHTDPYNRITVKDSAGNVIATGVADKTGVYQITLANVSAGQEISVLATNVAGGNSLLQQVKISEAATTKTPKIVNELGQVTNQEATPTVSTTSSVIKKLLTALSVSKNTSDQTVSANLPQTSAADELQLSLFGLLLLTILSALGLVKFRKHH